MTKYDLINKIIVDLNNLTVKGAENMAIVMRSIQNLSALSDGMRSEDAAHQKRVEDLEQEVKNHAKADDEERQGA